MGSAVPAAPALVPVLLPVPAQVLVSVYWALISARHEPSLTLLSRQGPSAAQVTLVETQLETQAEAQEPLARPASTDTASCTRLRTRLLLLLLFFKALLHRCWRQATLRCTAVTAALALRHQQLYPRPAASVLAQ